MAWTRPSLEFSQCAQAQTALVTQATDSPATGTLQAIYTLWWKGILPATLQWIHLAPEKKKLKKKHWYQHLLCAYLHSVGCMFVYNILGSISLTVALMEPEWPLWPASEQAPAEEHSPEQRHTQAMHLRSTADMCVQTIISTAPDHQQSSIKIFQQRHKSTNRTAQRVIMWLLPHTQVSL